MNKGEERKVKNRNVGVKWIKRVNTEDETGIYCISHSDSLNRDLKNLCGESVKKKYNIHVYRFRNKSA